MVRRFSVVLVVSAMCGVVPATVFGQGAGPEEGSSRATGGLRVRSVGLSASRFSQHVPPGIITFPDVFLGSSDALSGSADVNLARFGRRSFISIDYAANYGATFSEGNPKTWSHSVSGVFSTPVAKRWRLSAGGGAAIMSFDVALFYPSTVRKIVLAETTVRELAASLASTATPANPDLAIAGGLQSDLTTERFIFGRRMVNQGGQVDLVYSPSQKLAVDMAVNAQKIRNAAPETFGFEFPQVTSGGAALNVNYSMSNRTLLGFGAGYLRSDSPSFAFASGSGSISVSRVQRRWFYSLTTGVVQSRQGTDRHQTLTFGSAIGIKTRSHSLVANYNRGIGDRYIGVLGTAWWVDTVDAAWHWKPLRANWWFDTVFVDRHAITSRVATTNSWSQQAIFGRELGRHFSIISNISVGRVGAQRYLYAGRPYQLAQKAYQVSVMWFPQAQRTPRGGQ
jgi:hypothetical protein